MRQRGSGDAIVKTIISLAKTLGMRVTSEGIETAEQLSALQELGCDWGQGYFFARPLETQAMTDYLDRPPHEWETTLREAA